MKSITRRRFLASAATAAVGAQLLKWPVRGVAAELPARSPADVGLDASKLDEIERLVRDIVDRGVCGADLLIARRGAIVKRLIVGSAAVTPETRPFAETPIFDMASLTKVVATTTAMAQLVEAGKVDVDAKASTYLPAFEKAEGDRATVTVRHLLTHTAGIPAGGRYRDKQVTVDKVVEDIVRSRRMGAPGERFIYSDYSAVAWQAIIEAVSGQRLDAYCQEHIFKPLGMRETMYCPTGEFAERCAATAPEDDPARRGVVHDPTARALGGVSGNAGLFSTAPDLARFCQMMLNEGELDGARILKADTVRMFTAGQELTSGQRGLGWDRDSGYSIRGDLPVGSYGHTGFTGTSLWIDPTTQTFIILLSNVTHGSPPKGGVIALRRQISSLVAAAMHGD